MGEQEQELSESERRLLVNTPGLPGHGRARCPLCTHTTYTPANLDTGWCEWCKAFTYVGRDGIDRTGSAGQLATPQLVYSGAMWRHGVCGELTEGELYAYRARDGVWCLSVDPVFDPLRDTQSVPRCYHCGAAVYTLDMITGYWALVVAPVERVGAAERVNRMALPLPFTDTVPPGEISAQP